MANEAPVVSLTSAKRGAYCIVSLEGGMVFIRKLANLGVQPGSRIEVLSSSSMGGPVRVSVKGVQIGIGRGMAARIYVRTAGAIEYTLRDYSEGQRGKVLEISGGGKFKKRILEMGFVKGAEVYVEKYAPLRDPIELIIKGYHVSLRRDEAQLIVMSEPEG